MKNDHNVKDIHIPGYTLKEYETYKDAHHEETKFIFQHRFLRSIRIFEIVWTETETSDHLYTTFKTYSFLHGNRVSEKQNEIECNLKENIKNSPDRRFFYLFENKKLHTSNMTEEKGWDDFLSEYFLYIIPSFLGIFTFSVLFFFSKENISFCLSSGIFASFSLSALGSVILTCAFKYMEKKNIARSYLMTFIFFCLLTPFLIL